MAVEFRSGSGCVALIVGCFGVVRSGHASFSVYGMHVRDEWQQRALGELLVRRLEVAVLEKCADRQIDGDYTAGRGVPPQGGFSVDVQQV